VHFDTCEDITIGPGQIDNQQLSAKEMLKKFTIKNVAESDITLDP